MRCVFLERHFAYFSRGGEGHVIYPLWSNLTTDFCTESKKVLCVDVIIKLRVPGSCEQMNTTVILYIFIHQVAFGQETEGTFRYLSQAATCPSVYQIITHGGGFTLSINAARHVQRR